MKQTAWNDLHGDLHFERAAIAQLGERQTEDLEVLGSIPGLGKMFGLAK
jgi:hypothetical protein